MCFKDYVKHRQEGEPESLLQRPLGVPHSSEKMKYTLLTNSGSERRMAQLDVKVNSSGGAAHVDTITDKQVISVNQFFTTEELNDGNTLEMFKWASTLKQAKDVNKLKDYIHGESSKM